MCTKYEVSVFTLWIADVGTDDANDDTNNNTKDDANDDDEARRKEHDCIRPFG